MDFALSPDQLAIQDTAWRFSDEHMVRDLRVHQILEGTNEIMRVIISREVFRQ